MSSDPKSPANAGAQPGGARPADAASLLVHRAGLNGVEVLMGVRSGRHRFMPNRLVFPGGRVDPNDHVAPLRSPLSPATVAALVPGSGRRLAISLAVAALRETEEETSLRLRGDNGALDLAPLVYLGRIVTPPDQPIRFNARFLALSWQEEMGEPVASDELDDVGFRPIAAALREPIPRPTRAALTILAELMSGARPRPWLVTTWPGQRTRPGERARPEPPPLVG